MLTAFTNQAPLGRSSFVTGKRNSSLAHFLRRLGDDIDRRGSRFAFCVVLIGGIGATIAVLSLQWLVAWVVLGSDGSGGGGGGRASTETGNPPSLVAPLSGVTDVRLSSGVLAGEKKVLQAPHCTSCDLPFNQDMDRLVPKDFGPLDPSNPHFLYKEGDNRFDVRSGFDSFSKYAPSVDQLLKDLPPVKLRICFATFALMGPIKNGGIATADTNLAQAFQRAGHDVTILYMWGAGVQMESIEHWIDYYGNRGISLIPMPESEVKLAPSSPSKYIRKSYEAYEYLRDRESSFDIIHFHEWHGPGYYTTLAKHDGLAFRDTLLVTTVHCPSLFYMLGNLNYLSTWNNFASDFLERKQVLYSDIVVSPSHYMLDWVQKNGWELPQHVFVQQNLLSDSIVNSPQQKEIQAERDGTRSDGADSTAVGGWMDVSEFVFFARIEILKGVEEFCDALDMLVPLHHSGAVPSFSVTFLGNGNMPGESAVDYVERRKKEGQWPYKVQILTEYLQPEAVQYMQQNGRVGVLASHVENSPYTVLECLALQIPFIASNVGGIPELIHPDDRKRVLFKPSSASLFEQLRHSLIDGVRMPRGVTSPSEVKKDWLSFQIASSLGLHRDPKPPSASRIQELRTSLGTTEPERRRTISLSIAESAPKEPESLPLVSVCIITHDRGSLLLSTMDALLKQDYLHYEILLVDDGSTKEEQLTVLKTVEEFYSSPRFASSQPQPTASDASDTADSTGSNKNTREGKPRRERAGLPRFRLIRQANLYPGAARNHCAREATGEYVVFLDDDDVPKKRWLSTMVHTALVTGADVVTCLCDFFHGDGVPQPSFKPSLRWLPVGDAIDLGMYHNVFGAYSAVVKRESFFKIGGYTTDYGSTFEDWEFFSTAVLGGFKLRLVPEPLLWYRQNPGSHLMKDTSEHANKVRALRPYFEKFPQLRNALFMGYGASRFRKGET